MRQTRHYIQSVFFFSIVILAYVFKFNVEAYCPFGAVESLHTYFSEGKMLCALGSGNFYALGIILVLTLLFRRLFCGYVCPIGAASELMRSLAGDFNYNQLRVGEKFDRGLSLLKYLVLVLVLIMTAATVNLFYRQISPCYLLASINDDIVFSTYVAGAVFLTGSFLVSMPFCRWVCPFAAVQNLFSCIGLSAIHRDVDGCIHCQKCSKACPMNIDVAHQTAVKSANCISCFECVEVCPMKKEHNEKILSWKLLGKFRILNPGAVILASIALGVIATASASLLVDFPTFMDTRDLPKPAALEKTVLQVQGISCSGSAKLFVYFLDRRDISQIEGYVKVATRPRTGWIDVTIWHDPAKTDQQAIIEAVTEAYYDESEQRWRPSPFEVKGYNPLDM
jgi:polyferredoxin